jgi:hypothetical protein
MMKNVEQWQLKSLYGIGGGNMELLKGNISEKAASCKIVIV